MGAFVIVTYFIKI